MSNRNKYDLFGDIRPSKSDYKTTGSWIIWVFITLIGIGSLSYFWTRYVGSNQQRELLLNSGKREAASLVNLGEAITSCEQTIANRDFLTTQRDQYEPGTEPYRLANIDVKGTEAVIAGCSGTIQNILDTTEVENAPEFQNLKPRIEKLNKKL